MAVKEKGMSTVGGLIQEIHRPGPVADWQYD